MNRNHGWSICAFFAAAVLVIGGADIVLGKAFENGISEMMFVDIVLLGVYAAGYIVGRRAKTGILTDDDSKPQSSPKRGDCCGSRDIPSPGDLM